MHSNAGSWFNRVKFFLSYEVTKNPTSCGSYYIEVKSRIGKGKMSSGIMSRLTDKYIEDGVINNLVQKIEGNA